MTSLICFPFVFLILKVQHELRRDYVPESGEFSPYTGLQTLHLFFATTDFR